MAEDVKNVPASSIAHRLATVSATHALKEAQQDHGNFLSLGTNGLDAFISSCSGTSSRQSQGMAQGELLELIGPPGAGKTTICMHAAASALINGNTVIWIDTHTGLAAPRFQKILEGRCTIGETFISLHDMLGRFRHYTTPSLAHLLALILHGPPSFVPSNTSLMVIDSVSALIDSEFARFIDYAETAEKPEARNSLAARRKRTIAVLAARLSLLAAAHNMAIIVTSNVTTKIIPGAGATLRSALINEEWKSAFHSRALVYCDWVAVTAKEEQEQPENGVVRFIELLDSRQSAEVNQRFAFTIGESDIREAIVVRHVSPSQTWKASSPGPSKKRPHAEITDSEGESEGDYSWLTNAVAVEDLAAEGLLADI